MLMHQVNINLEDGDVIPGFALPKDLSTMTDSNEGLIFQHGEGGTAFMPIEDIVNVEIIERNVEVKVEKVVEPKAKKSYNSSKLREGSNTEKVANLAKEYEGDIKSVEFRQFVMSELNITEGNARYAIKKL